jgi:NhaP-type Na+/H+ or K+/H+ antiporter
LAITIGLVFRSLGVWLCTLGSRLNRGERLFCVIAYLPKATVQAALGGVALSHGLPHGETILAIAVLSILFTAPLGLLGIRLFGQRLLSSDPAFGLPAPQSPGRVGDP